MLRTRASQNSAAHHSAHRSFFQKGSLRNPIRPFFSIPSRPMLQAQLDTPQLQRQESTERRSGTTVLSLFASGYSRNYSTDEAEIRAVEHRGPHDPENPAETWWPTTIDFEAAARAHGGRVRGVASMNDVIENIQRQRGLSEVRLFTHGARGEIQFGSGGRLTRDSSLPNLSCCFGTGGRIIFYACNAGYDETFFQALANQLQVTVCGFSRGVRWSIEWNPTTRAITSRGLHGRELPSPGICSSPRS